MHNSFILNWFFSFCCVLHSMTSVEGMIWWDSSRKSKRRGFMLASELDPSLRASGLTGMFGNVSIHISGHLQTLIRQKLFFTKKTIISSRNLSIINEITSVIWVAGVSHFGYMMFRESHFEQIMNLSRYVIFLNSLTPKNSGKQLYINSGTKTLKEPLWLIIL